MAIFQQSGHLRHISAGALNRDFGCDVLQSADYYGSISNCKPGEELSAYDSHITPRPSFERTLSASPAAAARCSFDASMCGSAAGCVAGAATVAFATVLLVVDDAIGFAGAALGFCCGCLAAASCCKVAGLGW